MWFHPLTAHGVQCHHPGEPLLSLGLAHRLWGAGQMGLAMIWCHRDSEAMAVALPSTMALTGTVCELAFGKTQNETPHPLNRGLQSHLVQTFLLFKQLRQINAFVPRLSAQVLLSCPLPALQE